jgi:hypothetical protein
MGMIVEAMEQMDKALERADALAASLVSGCECCENPCGDYTLARLYLEARNVSDKIKAPVAGR